MNPYFCKLVFSSGLVLTLVSVGAYAQTPAPAAPSVPENSGAARPAPAPAPPPNSGASGGPPANPIANTPADPQSPGAVILPAPGTPPVGTIPSGQSRPLASPFSKFDSDGDGRLSQEEAKGDGTLYNRFKAMDSNKDNYISSDEFGASGVVLAPISKPAKQEAVTTGTK